jgi:hypothetical protein
MATARLGSRVRTCMRCPTTRPHPLPLILLLPPWAQVQLSRLHLPPPPPRHSGTHLLLPSILPPPPPPHSGTRLLPPPSSRLQHRRPPSGIRLLPLPPHRQGLRLPPLRPLRSGTPRLPPRSTSRQWRDNPRHHPLLLPPPSGIALPLPRSHSLQSPSQYLGLSRHPNRLPVSPPPLPRPSKGPVGLPWTFIRQPT